MTQTETKTPFAEKCQKAKVKVKRWATWALIIFVLIFAIGLTLGVVLS